jgi:hypothetical protein
MKKVLLILFFALLTINLHATCANEGQHNTGGSISASGSPAILNQTGIPSGCFLYITHIIARMTQTASTGAGDKLAFWTNSTCTGTPTYELATMGVSAVNHNSDTWEFKADANGAIRTGPSTAVCVGFESGATGVVESVTWTGYFSGNNL